jgi:hypothetical protein
MARVGHSTHCALREAVSLECRRQQAEKKVTGLLTFGTLLKIAPELILGVCLKLFCDNGRVHWRDLVNDVFFWIPGVEAQDSDGLSREFVMLTSGQSRHEIPENAVLAK